MADQQHIEILIKGVDIWNAWRMQDPIKEPDLSGANFRRADLRGVNLSRTNLREVDFRRADLRRADLNGADLRKAILGEAVLNGADLRGANLSYANLSKVDFSEAWIMSYEQGSSDSIGINEANLNGANLSMVNLRDADFRGVDLRNADLSGADLEGANLSAAELDNANLSGADLRGTNFTSTDLDSADFSNALMGLTIFGDIDLRKVKGLETIIHEGPSTIGIDTILRSEGDIPEDFLRGAGASDAIIEYIHSLSMKPIQYYTCFITYSGKNQDFAEHLYADLQRKGVRCWFAPEDLKIGDHYHQRIDESIRPYDKLILILSEHAIQSAWVEREVVAAREKEDREERPVLFPIRLDDAAMNTTKAWAADVRRRWHIGDFTQWKHHDIYQEAFDRLLHDLKAGKQR